MTEPNGTWGEALDFVLRREGGYIWDKDDPGGETNMGITRATWDAYWRKQGAREPLPLKEATKETVAPIYHANYWLAAGCDKLAWPLSLFVFDAAVNCGVGQALKWRPNDASTPMAYLNLRRDFYLSLVAKRPKLSKFLRGWLKRCDALEAYL